VLITLLFSVSLLLQRPAVGAIAVDKSKAQSPPKQYVVPFTEMATPPSLPKVDLNSCPFEGCQFGKWTADKPVTVYSTWKTGRKPIAKLQKAEEVIALTGINLTIRPAKGIFSQDSPMLGAKKGDVAYMYQNCGEGASDLWTHGRFIKCADPNFSWKRGSGCEDKCDGKYTDLGKSEWWAQIRLKNGSTGWVLAPGNFDGTDALE
jgi:hypothetical protein